MCGFSPPHHASAMPPNRDNFRRTPDGRYEAGVYIAGDGYGRFVAEVLLSRKGVNDGEVITLQANRLPPESTWGAAASKAPYLGVGARPTHIRVRGRGPRGDVAEEPCLRVKAGGLERRWGPRSASGDPTSTDARRP